MASRPAEHPITPGRGVLLAGAALLLAALGWQALSGALRQLPRARTLGQKVETVVQFESGLLSLLVAVTCFWRRGWAGLVRSAWGMSLAGAAGLSALVWGPAMPHIAMLFAAGGLLVARAVTWALRTALAEGLP